MSPSSFSNLCCLFPVAAVHVSWYCCCYGCCYGCCVAVAAASPSRRSLRSFNQHQHTDSQVDSAFRSPLCSRRSLVYTYTRLSCLSLSSHCHTHPQTNKERLTSHSVRGYRTLHRTHDSRLTTKGPGPRAHKDQEGPRSTRILLGTTWYLDSWDRVIGSLTHSRLTST